MKKTVCILLLAAVLLSMGGAASALFERANVRELDRVLDGAELLSDEEEADLETYISKVSEKYNFDILVLTVNSDVGDIGVWSEGIYDLDGYGYGLGNDGILLVFSMYTSEWLISATGYGETAFTDYGRNRIGDIVADDLARGDYEKAFDRFVGLSEKFLRQAAKGSPFDYGNRYRTFSDYAVRIVIGVAVGCIMGALIVAGQKKGMNTALFRRNATSYMDEGSLVLTGGRDVFLTSIVTKTPKAPPPQQRGSGGGSSGGGGGHTAPSGGHHASSRGKI
ncbi:MAG: TPM domain-containing protein [Clostridiales bacterium]|nr:TPM domain-containing protein [Clostridiales bacterium]